VSTNDGRTHTDRAGPDDRRLPQTRAGGSHRRCCLALAGCLGDGEDGPGPVALDGGQSCDQCNMQVDVHPGPAGQAYYLDGPPEDLPTDREEGGELVISAHLEAEAFTRAGELTYAVDSDVQGAMGGSLIGFSDADDADAFTEEYGGTRVEHGDITREMVASL